MDRRILINSYAKGIIKELKIKYPELRWLLTLTDNDKEFIIGVDNSGTVKGIGHSMEEVEASLCLMAVAPDIY